MTATFLCGAFWLACLAGGCGGDSDASEKDQFFAQLCAEYADCCAAAGLPSDGAQCRAVYGAFAPASGYDQAAAQQCLDEVRASGSQKCEMDATNTPSCRKVFAPGGTKKPGEACEDDDDCAPAEAGDVECESDFVDGATIQQCQVRLPGQAGSTPCVGTVDGNLTYYSGPSNGIPSTGYLCDLADGISCNSQTGACEQLAAVGEPCSGGSQCVSSAYCPFPDNVCTARLAVGSACGDDEECVEGAYCEPTGKTCTDRRATGEACSANAECDSNDCTNQKCAAGNDFGLTFLCGSG